MAKGQDVTTAGDNGAQGRRANRISEAGTSAEVQSDFVGSSAGCVVGWSWKL